LFVIIGELFFHNELAPYHFWIEVIDIIIIAVFATDLVFKYQRTRNIKKFLKRYWLDIIAIFPFFLIFRVAEEAGLVASFFRETISPGQKILHEGLEVQEGASKIVSGLEKEGAKIASQVGKVSRTEKLMRFIRPIARSPRMLKYASDDAAKKLKAEVKAIEKGAEHDLKVGERYLKKGEKFVEKEIVKEEKWFKRRVLNAFVFYEKPSGKHHIHE